MKKIRETHTWYACEICGQYHDTEDEAVECEAKQPTKIEANSSWSKEKEWQIGDFVAIHIHDTGWRLAEIQGTQQQGHKIVPVFRFMDGTRHVMDHWDYEAVVLQPDMQKQLLKWADKIRARQRAARREAKKKETKPLSLPR